MREASATPFRESFDFTPKRNRAERVQTVNGACQSRLFQCFGALDHVIDVYSAERDRNCPLGLGKRRPDHVMDQRRARWWRLADVVGSHGYAQNIVGRNAVALACERVDAVCSTDTFKNAIPYERLAADGGWLMLWPIRAAGTGIDCGINYSGNGKHALSGHQRHF